MAPNHASVGARREGAWNDGITAGVIGNTVAAVTRLARAAWGVQRLVHVCPRLSTMPITCFAPNTPLLLSW